MSPTSRSLDLPCRYYRVYTDPGVPCVESRFGFVHRRLPLPAAQTALVLVDLWSVHYIESWLARAAAITRTKIVPLLDAARAVGMTVLHAPSPFIADRYVPAPESAPAPEAGWPPPGFRGIYRSGAWAPFGRNPEPILPGVYARYETALDIDPAVKPRPGEPVLHTGAQMHALLAARRILHLVYVGYATNWCVVGRDYGIYAMNERGYNIILVRDATCGIEFHDTVDTGAATAMTIREIETKNGWSTTTEEFVAACGETIRKEDGE